MDEVKSALQKRYKIHPLLFKRCVENTKNASELFDCLESIPDKYPIVWDNDLKQWKTTKLFDSKASKNEDL